MASLLRIDWRGDLDECGRHTGITRVSFTGTPVPRARSTADALQHNQALPRAQAKLIDSIFDISRIVAGRL